MKSCSICKQFKALEEFPMRRDSKDGHRADCKECKSKRDAEAWAKKMLCPIAKAKESLRVKALRARKTPEELEAIANITNARNRNKAVKRNQAFLEEHGCTKKEYKRRKDEQEFIAFGKNLNGDKYDYSEVVYQGVWPEVTIICNKHKYKFQQSPKSHKIGSGCPLCAREQCGLYHKKSQEQFIQEIEAVCGHKYTFENTVYVNYHTHVDVTCKEHGPFSAQPANLFSGKGCPACASYGYNPSKEGSVYILATDNLVKVGITNRPVDIRKADIVRSSGKDFRIFSYYWFADGYVPQNIERDLLKALKQSYDSPVEKFDGSTECFYGVDPVWLKQEVSKLVDQYHAS